MLYGRNDEQTEGRHLSSTRISSSEDPYSSSYAVNAKTNSSTKYMPTNIIIYCITQHGKSFYLKHFNRKYSVKGSLHFKRADISDDDLHILQLKIPTNRKQNKLAAHSLATQSGKQLIIYAHRHCSSIKAFCVVELQIPVTLQLLYFCAMYKDKDPQPHPTSRTV